MQPEHGQGGAGDEVAAFVEHPVIGQVVLELPGHYLAAVHDYDRVAGTLGVAIQVSHDGGQLAATVGSKQRGQSIHSFHRRGGERLAHRQVLHRIPGQCHFAEHHDVCTGGAGLPARYSDHRGVARKITHAGVHLS
jgi:hypothetical protein